MVVADQAPDGGSSFGAVAKPVDPLPSAPRAVAEKSMLRQELWPRVSSFANLAEQFNEEMWRVMLHFLVELDMARERQAAVEAFDTQSRAATADTEQTAVW